MRVEKVFPTGEWANEIALLQILLGRWSRGGCTQRNHEDQRQRKKLPRGKGKWARLGHRMENRVSEEEF